jgi:hypothetical protein
MFIAAITYSTAKEGKFMIGGDYISKYGQSVSIEIPSQFLRKVRNKRFYNI